jgi:hypothetical protein
MASKLKQINLPSTLLAKRDPRAKFVELANLRVARAIKDLRLIGNLSNRRNYDYSEAESKRIVKTLEVELEDLKAKFRGKQNDATELFKL